MRFAQADTCARLLREPAQPSVRDRTMARLPDGADTARSGPSRDRHDLRGARGALMRSFPLSPGPPDEQRDHRPGRGLERCTVDASPTSTRQVSYPVRRPKLPDVTCGTGRGGGRTTVGLARVWTESRRDSQDELTSRPRRTGPRNGPTGARAMIVRCGTRTSAGSSSRPSGAAPKHSPTERTQKGSGVAGPSVRSPGEGP